MSQQALAARFLMRTRVELEQMRACLPDASLPIEPLATAHLERMAHKVANAADAFGFPEISVIAGAIELLSQASAGRTVRERVELSSRLTAQLSALEVQVEYELAEREAHKVPEELAATTLVPTLGARRK
jgi:HPt (histidine-containing phosphotransfer) domain-containing protein